MRLRIDGAANMIIKRIIAFCILFFSTSHRTLADFPTPSQFQLPFKPTAKEPIDYTQRRDAPLRIRATRQIKVLAGKGHRSKNNIVAVYIGLPIIDPAQDNVVIEHVQSKMADASNVIFSADGDSLLVEYFNVKPGFCDEISLTFTVDIYERRANLTGAKPYNKESPLYQRYTQDQSYAGVLPANGEPNPILQKHLKNAGVSPDVDPINKALRIYEYLGRELSYGSFHDAEKRPADIIESKKAHCGEYALLFVTLCQEAGVPARRCAGFAFAENAQNKNDISVSGHNWAEFYVEGIGWIPVDPTMGDKDDLRKQYYFGGLDNARLCVSKGGFHNRLPLWHKTSPEGELIFTQDASDFKPFKYPDTIQGVHRFQYRFDLPIRISVPDPYGPSLTILSKQGKIRKPSFK